MSGKPTHTLTQLEEEPQSGFFGCTYSELTAAMRSAIKAVLVSAVCLTFFINWALAMALSFIPGIWVFMRKVKKATLLRADKPLYYHRHVRTAKSSAFIQPAQRYQRERNR